MAEIIVFTPKSAVTADENLRGFVDMCRDQLTVFGVDLLFDEITWDVTESVHIKGHGNKRFRITFSNLATVDSAAPSPMKEPCLSFAKAYVRYMQGMRPTKVISNRLASLRALEAALGENGVEPDPVRVDAAILNRAAQLITDRFSRAAAYRVGGQLELLAAFMSTNRLTSVPTTNWRSPIQRPIDTVRVGKEFDERRANKMPSAAALEALPKIFRLATEPGDVVVSSVAAILCSAPDRINEVLLLPVDCEVRQPREGEGDAYGLRWWPAKGADPMVKWVIPSFASVVAEAVAKLRARSEPARDVARWYENHPDKIYLPGRLERFRCRQYLGMDELGEVLWDGAYGKAAPNQWCKANSIPLTDDGSKPCVRFRDVERVCLEALPLGFPILNSETGLKYSDALLVTRRNEFNADKATFRGVIQGVTIARIADGLGARAQHGFRSVFDKFEFTDNGSPIKVTTHQFRHYLNTLAQAGGMSQLDIAKWSGRKDISQNAAYDHETPQQLVAKLRAAIGDEQQMFGPLAELPKYSYFTG